MNRAIIIAALAAAACQNAVGQSYLLFDDLRARGELHSIVPPGSTLTLCSAPTSVNSCVPIGTIRQDNIIEWNENATLDILKSMVQAQHDAVAYRALQYKKLLEQK